MDTNTTVILSVVGTALQMVGFGALCLIVFLHIRNHDK